MSGLSYLGEKFLSYLRNWMYKNISTQRQAPYFDEVDLDGVSNYKKEPNFRMGLKSQNKISDCV